MSGTLKTGNVEKGARYLALLDRALCNGQWAEVPEFARKVDKHAPERKCLTTAARAEAELAAASHRPSSALSTTSTSIHGLSGLVPKLREAMNGVKPRNSDDIFIGKICLAEVYWMREDATAALEVLSGAHAPTNSPNHTTTSLGWLEVCSVKADFIKATCLESAGRRGEAWSLYESIVTRTPGYRSPELRTWTERLLARACIYHSKEASAPSMQIMGEMYMCFKSWSAFWQRVPSSTAGVATNLSRIDVPRRQVWKLYYDLLSHVLQSGLTYNPSSKSTSDVFVSSFMGFSEDEHTSIKSRQRTEIQNWVEPWYEKLLLNETKFPSAKSSNREIELWIEQVVRNWKVLCGPGWSNEDFGDGGKKRYSRGVVDILYRAATMTFHSTVILRHLFTVHASLAEFDLAIHAFDSYVEIVEKGKARAEKTGQHDPDLDDDETIILTAAEAVRVLCRYGERDQFEKAVQIGRLIEKWLGQQFPPSVEKSNLDGMNTNGEREDAVARRPDTDSSLPPRALAAAYQAIAISQAQWSRITYENERRKSLLAEANNNLRRSQKFDQTSIDTAQALAFVLAEMRDISGALEVCRAVFAAQDHSVSSDENTATPREFERQRRLIPLWHLLALCLSAKQEYEGAFKVCEAAFSQFADASGLFDAMSQSNDPDEEKAPHPNLHARGMLSQLESLEKETIVQMKMSQITFEELLEGTDDAVDMTDQLLSLYAQVFGNPEQIAAALPKPPPTAASNAPSKFGGTFRSIKGSIKAKSGRNSVENDAARQYSLVSMSESTITPPSNYTRSNGNSQSMDNPIAITVTNEDNVPVKKSSDHHAHLPRLPFKTHGHGATSEKANASFVSLNAAGAHQNEKKPDSAPSKTAIGLSETSEAPAGPNQMLQEIPHNKLYDDITAPHGHEEQPPRQDLRLPAPTPGSRVAKAESQFALIQERRHKVSVLVNVWLFIAGLYIRAESLDDAANAVNETIKLVESLEMGLSGADDGSTARRLFFSQWGGGKSIDLLWADVWSMKGRLASARERPFEAIGCYDQALLYYPDHGDGIIGISDLLMDIYEEKLPAEEPQQPLQPTPSASGSLLNDARRSPTRPNSSSNLPSRRPSQTLLEQPILAEEIEKEERKPDPTPAELNRLAARDRAYMLLSNLTKLGGGWDNSEAWLTLARAYELGRQVGKAKQALWWVVELEDSRPMRNWREVIPGGYTL